jgi:hypothetical protein
MARVIPNRIETVDLTFKGIGLAVYRIPSSRFGRPKTWQTKFLIPTVLYWNVDYISRVYENHLNS